MQVSTSHHWHHLSETDAASLLGADQNQGLVSSAASDRQERFGPNVLTAQRGQSPLVLFLLQFHQPLIYILLAAIVITGALREWVDAGVILGVVLVNAIIGFVQEWKASKAIDALSRAMTSETTVLRDGERRRLPAAELVPGDIVLLQSGDKVPADLRLIRCKELQIDESALTGESLPVAKQSDMLPADTLLADRTNMAYSSTLVTYGAGVGVVAGIGDQTEIGRINTMIATADVLATPLTNRIEHFSRILLIVILLLAALTFAIGLLRGESWLEMFMAAIALSVGAIPEGLPAAMTIALAIGVAKMARRNAIIRKLPAVETLGSTTVICSDKTGTLTQNEMTVQQIWAGGEQVSVTGIGYAPHGDFNVADSIIDPTANIAMRECLRAGLLCNDSTLVAVDDGWHVEGDPTEGALITSARKARLAPAQLTDELPRIDAIPFESQYQFMATLHATDSDARIVYVKGSVESILARCHYAMTTSGEVQALDCDEVHAQVDLLTAQGLRVLAFASSDRLRNADSIGHKDLKDGLVFLGLQGMIDPPRPEAITAIRDCQRAGIKVKMITGDHAGTAAAIAREIGLHDSSPDGGAVSVLNGKQLANMTDDELIHAVQSTAVFARVAPEQKLRLVESLQAAGEVVAMTGDGVNDAPALRRANIGVAMGITGTEVSKEAADMVLTDDNFSSIAAAVEEGRGVYDNLVKFITWTLPTNLGEGLVILAAIITGQTLPITPVQILWINMTTAVLLGLMLAFEPKEPAIMARKPREADAPILSRLLFLRITLVGFLLLVGSFGLFEYELFIGASEAKARTTAVNVFVTGEIFYLFNCRSLHHSMFRIGVFSNPWVLFGVAAMIVLQMFFTYAPIMHSAFGSEPLGFSDWSLILGVGFFVYLAVGTEKWLRQRTTKRFDRYSRDLEMVG